MTEKESPLGSMSRRDAIRNGALASIALAGVGTAMGSTMAKRGGNRGKGGNRGNSGRGASNGRGVAYTTLPNVKRGKKYTVGAVNGSGKLRCEGNQKKRPHEVDGYSVSPVTTPTPTPEPTETPTPTPTPEPTETPAQTVTASSSTSSARPRGNFFVLTGHELGPNATIEIEKIIMGCSATAQGTTLHKVQFSVVSSGTTTQASARGRGASRGAQNGRGVAYTYMNVRQGQTLTLGRFKGTVERRCEGKQQTQPHELDQYAVRAGANKHFLVLTGRELSPGTTVKIEKILLECTAQKPKNSMFKVQFSVV